MFDHDDDEFGNAKTAITGSEIGINPNSREMLLNLDSTLRESLAKHVSELSITNIDQTLECMPSKDNGHTAVVRSTIGTHDGRCYSTLGCVDPHIAGTKDPAALITAASFKGLNDSINYTKASLPIQKKQMLDITPASAANHQDSAPGPKKYKHKTTEPMSQGQERFVQGLAQKNGLNPEEISRKVCGKQLRDCSSADANEIIQHMKGIY